MANITISELGLNGSALFQSHESFLCDLNEHELSDITGAGKVTILWTALCVEW
jgi:hypothetical protein